MDADASEKSITMGALQRSAPLSIGIVDRDQLEDTEDFYVSLFRVGLTDQIAVGCEHLVIEITDDDTANLLVEQREPDGYRRRYHQVWDVVVENEMRRLHHTFPIRQLAPNPPRVQPCWRPMTRPQQECEVPTMRPPRGSVEFETVVTAGTQADQTVVIEVETATDSRITLDGPVVQCTSYTVTVVDDGN